MQMQRAASPSRPSKNCSSVELQDKLKDFRLSTCKASKSKSNGNTREPLFSPIFSQDSGGEEESKHDEVAYNDKCMKQILEIISEENSKSGNSGSDLKNKEKRAQAKERSIISMEEAYLRLGKQNPNLEIVPVDSEPLGINIYSAQSKKSRAAKKESPSPHKSNPTSESKLNTTS